MIKVKRLMSRLPQTKKAHRLLCHGLFCSFRGACASLARLRAHQILATALRGVGVFVPLLELIDTTCCVNQLHLAGEEGVRTARNFEFYQGECLAVNLDGVLGVGSTLSDKSLFVAHIFENYKTI